MLEKIRNYQKVIKMKEYKEKYHFNLGPFGEERYGHYLDSDEFDFDYEKVGKN